MSVSWSVRFGERRPGGPEQDGGSEVPGRRHDPRTSVLVELFSCCKDGNSRSRRVLLLLILHDGAALLGALLLALHLDPALAAVDAGALDRFLAVLLGRVTGELVAGGQHAHHGGGDGKTESLLACHGA